MPSLPDASGPVNGHGSGGLGAGDAEREDNLARLAERIRADADQTASDADQTASDTDQTASDADASAASEDQQASDADQALVDDREPGDKAERAHADENRVQRDATTARRQATGQERAENDRTRYETATERDATAQERDQSSEELDRAVAASDVPLLRQLAELRFRVAEERARAARDRAAAARERAELEAALRSADLDGLTGVFRRDPGELTLEREIERARRGDGRFVLAFVDVDGLKQVNDRDGHAAGDEVLRSVGKRLRSHLRPFDPVVRYGGDEFICGIGAAIVDDIQPRFDRIRQSLRDDSGIGVTVGLAQLAPNETLTELTARADAALLAAKGYGNSPGARAML